METDQNIKKAIDGLNAGTLIGLPTETVYGLAGDASNPEAVKKIFALKNRPADHPLIVHIANAHQLKDWAAELPDYVTPLIEKFWPGPLTLVCQRQSHVLDVVTGRQNTVAIRCPDHPVAQRVLQSFNGGVCAPSANPFGQLSPTTAEHVRDYFSHELDIVLDGGPCRVGIESTILDVSGTQPQILRPGMLTASDLNPHLPQPCLLPNQQNNTPRVSGQLDQHYSPRTPLHLIAREQLPDYLTKQPADQLVVLSTESLDVGNAASVILPKVPSDYAQQLYNQLHQLDAKHFTAIVVITPPETEGWAAIHDRLKRASTVSIHTNS